MEKVFYIKDWAVVYAGDPVELSTVPLLEKRKLSLENKMALSTMLKVYNNSIDEIITVSEFGEIDRLKKIIEQYQSVNEVSPAQFSASVHNYIASFFCRLKQINIPYYSLSGTIYSGVINAIVSENTNILLNYTDSLKSISVLITKKVHKTKYVLENPNNFNNIGFEAFLDFLQGKGNCFGGIKQVLL